MIDEILKDVCKSRYNEGVYILYDYNKNLINKMIKLICSNDITTNDLINRFDKVKNKILECERQIDFNCEVFMEIYNLYTVAFLSAKVFFNVNVLKDMIKSYKEKQILDIKEEFFIKVFEVWNGDKDFVVYEGWRKYILKFKNIFCYNSECIVPRERYFSYEIASKYLKNLEDIVEDYNKFIYG